MADTTTTLRLKAVDDGAIATIAKIDNAFTGLTIGTTALAVGFSGLSKAADSSFGKFVLGSQNADKVSSAIGRLADVNSKALKTFSALSDISFFGGQALTFAKGVQDAAAVYARIPQTLDLFRSTGVSTRSIEDFYTLTDAVKGSEASLEQFAVNAVEQLGRFEQAAARVGTILRSSTNFDIAGNALRANQQEQVQNAFQVQDIVNSQVKNAVTSTEALAGQYEVLSSGFTKAADSQQVLSSGLKLIGIAQAGGAAASSTDTLQLLVKTLNAYELGSAEAAKTSAILNATVDAGITTIQELSLNFGQTAKTAKAANVQLTDLASGTAVLTSQGINSANALTGLQRVFSSIISKTPESEKALAKLSLNGQKIRFDLAEVQAKGFTQALLDLNKAAGGNAQVLQDIFPEEIAFRTVLGLLAQDGQKLASTTASIGSVTASSLDEVFKIATGDRVNRFQQIANRFQELIIKVAQSVAPVFEPGLAVLERIASFFSNLPEPVKQSIGAFIAFQITSRATTSAVGILFQTMLTLAGSYLQVRLISLALSGQLGKELAVIKDLITQRKGLVAVALQLFGIDQRFRLGVEATTAALQKQNVVTKAVTAVRNKAGEVFNKNIAGFTGLDLTSAAEQGKRAVGGVVQTAKNVGLGVAEAVGVVSAPQILGPDGKPIVSGLSRVKAEADKVGQAIAVGLSNVKSIDASAALSTAYNNVSQGAQKAAGAIASTTGAIAASTTATATHTVVLTADELAEKGLAQTRIFGRNVLFATAGPLGAINTLLATEISLKTVGAGVTRTFATAQGLLSGSSGLLANVLKGGLIGSLNLLKGGFGVAANAVMGLLGTLGPLGPLLAVGGVALAIFREDLFGLRKAANEAAAGLGEVLKQDSELSKKFGTEQRLLQFKAEIKPDASATRVETRLEQLRLSGDLTTGQFNQLRETLARVGDQGQLTSKGLEEFKSQLEAIRQGAAGTPEKGFGDRVGEFFGGIPGTIGSSIDFGANSLAAFTTNPTALTDPIGAVSKTAQNRESDRLVQSFSQIGIALDVVGEQSNLTSEKINQYRKALGLTSETNEKLRKGTKLTADDLERENQIFNAQKSRNENLISGIEKNIAEQKKVSESIKDPELRATFDDRIQLLETERKTLENRNEALKSGREEFTKYYTETLPGLKRAITESSNLGQALGNAQANFGQQFKLDAQGNATPFLKDITTLKNEASQLQSQVLEAYQGGLFEQLAGPTRDGKPLFAPTGAAEAEVIKRLRAVRDNKIKLPDGTEGFRLSVSDRLAATQQISEIGQTSSKQIAESLKLDAERSKLLGQQRKISEEAVQREIAQIQIQGIKETLVQKEIEIKEYAQFPVRKAQLEREAAAIRVQIEQAVTAEDNRQLERRRGLRQEAFNVEIEQLRAQQSERQITEQQAQATIAQIQIKASRDRLNNLLEDFKKSGSTSVELSNKIAIARAQLRQQEAAEVERLFNLEQQRQKQIIANTAQLQTLTLQRQSSGIDSRTKDIEGRSQLLSSTAQLQGVLNQATEAGLQNQLKFTGDLEKRAAIETQIAENKVKNLAVTQQQEQVSLAVQAQINKLSLERESIQLRIQEIENQRQLAELNLELVRANRDKRTPEEIQAIELQIQGAQQQSDLLNEQGDRLERSKVQQAQIAENSRKELEIKQAIARADAEIELTLTRRREVQAGIEKQVKNIELASQQINLAGQIQIQQSEAISKTYDQQKSVLQASQNFVKGRVDFVTGELQIASELSNKERQKKDIAQLIAAIKLQSLETQLSMEEKVLTLNLAQQAAQLEQEKIRNRVSQAQAGAGVAQAQADLSKTQADPNATPEAIKAAQLNLQAKVEEAISLQFAGSLLNQQGQIQSTLGNLEKQSFQERSLLQRDQAQVEFAQTLNPREGRRLLRDIRDRSLSRALGVGRDEVGSTSTGEAFVRATKSQFFGDGALLPLEAFRANQVFNRLNPQTPSLQLDFPDFEQFRQNQLARFQEFGYNLPLAKTSPQELNAQANTTIMNAVSKLTELVNQKLSTPNSVNLEIPITNNFSTQDAATQKAATTTTQQIRQQLHDLGELLKRS
ncbi:MAG: phage tail tape measure protein [Nostoc sp. ChiSLP01]|nr:phage tail tape measure protein [Nostoc sp. CmiSLP01]MDZ8285233.1 phage tail tape measure protein [Nostoc sp. ChiSLP01]